MKTKPSALIGRFRSWQQNPFPKETPSSEQHTCANCENPFVGKYCPTCGQDSSVGPADWPAMWEEARILLGMEAESPVGSILQILCRPGYLINDYCRGRRKVCDSPVVTLMMVAVAIPLIMKYAGIGIRIDAFLEEVESIPVLSKAVAWLLGNLGWGAMLMTSYFILPTWLFFHHAPRNTFHNLPTGIYIQLFMNTLVLIFCALGAGISHWFLLLVPVYYWIAYRQFFGYSVWGTLWRVIFVFVDSVLFVVLLVWAVLAIFGLADTESYTALQLIATVSIMIAAIVALLVAGYYIRMKPKIERCEL